MSDNNQIDIEKKLVPECFHKWVYVFGKKQSGRMPVKKIQDPAIETKQVFVLIKRKVYPLLRKERDK